MDKMLEKIRTFWPVIMVLCMVLVTGAVAKKQITTNTDDIIKLQEKETLLIRMDERQKVLQKDMSKLQLTLNQILEKL